MGGKIIGVVPYFFNTPGILFEHCTELIRMETMAERKTIMEERSDAFIALPGGIGTMEEVFETITLSSLGRMKKKTAFQLIGKLFKTTWHCIWKKRKVEQAYLKKVQDKSISFD